MELNIVNHGTFLICKDPKTDEVYMTITSDVDHAQSMYRHTPDGWLVFKDQQEAEKIFTAVAATALKSAMQFISEGTEH